MFFVLKLVDGQIIQIPADQLENVDDPWQCTITVVGTRDILFSHVLTNGDNSPRLFQTIYEEMAKYPVTSVEEIGLVIDSECYYIFTGGLKALYYRDMSYMNAGHLEFKENFSIRFNFDIDNEVDFNDQLVKCKSTCPHYINGHKCKKYNTEIDGMVCEQCFLDTEQTEINKQLHQAYANMHEIYAAKRKQQRRI